LKPLTKYFLLTYLLSWTCFISVAVLSHGTQTPLTGSAVLQQVLVFLGTITPSLVALWLTARSGIPGQTQKLLGRIMRWEVNIKWYLFAAGFMVLIKLSVALLYKIITGVWPPFGKEAWYIMFVAILFSTWVQAGEEIGWRGFALPLMSEKSGLPGSALLLGVIWAFWHLPLFFVQGADTFGQSFPLYLLQVTALSVVLAWLYWRTQGSLLLVMLLHAAVNNTKGIVPSATPGATDTFGLSHSLVAWLTVALLWIFAIYCLIRMRSVKRLE
jgi:membrane protease YdiL (CAAX protease family)